MADNVGYTPGSGATIAADDVGGVLYQRIKITMGADAASTADLQGVAESGSSAIPALAVGGGTPNDSVDSGNPIKVGGYASAAAPSAVSGDGDRVAAWFTRRGSLTVTLADSNGTLTAPSSIDDAALGAVGAQLVWIGGGRGSTAVPTSVSSDGDAAVPWLSRFGATNIIPRDAAGLALFKDAVALANDTGNPTIGGIAAFNMAWDTVNSNWDRLASHGASSVDAKDGQGALQTGPIIYNGATFDTVRSIQQMATAATIASDNGVQAAGVGPGYDRKINPAGFAANSTSNAVTLVVNGSATTSWFITTIGTTPGNMIFEVSGDDSTWVTAPYVYLVNTGAWISGSFVPAVNDLYIVKTDGWRQVRYKVNSAYASGTATAKVVQSIYQLREFITGDLAHDAVDSGNPIKIGGTAKATAPTSVGSLDRVQSWFTLFGSQVTSISDGAAGILASVFGGAPGDSSSFVNPLQVAGPPMMYNGTTWDYGRSIAALSTAPNVDTGITAVGVGPGWDRKTNPAGVAATSTANAVTVVTNGAASMRFHVTTIGTTPGSMIFETTGDDSAWTTAAIVWKAGTDQYINGSFVPAVNDVFVLNTVGIRQVRYRVNAVYASGTATVKVTGSAAAMVVRPVPLNPSAGTKANVSGAASSTTLQAANANRMGWLCWNDSTATLYIDATGGTASATSASVAVGPGGYYELPTISGGGVYAGLITGIWSSATGAARVTEWA